MVNKLQPKSGYALIDKLTLTATDWKDPDLDYPLLYAFGYNSSLSKINLISKQANMMFSSFLTFIGDPIHVFLQVYDSLGDFTELYQSVSVKLTKNTTDLLEKMKKELNSGISIHHQLFRELLMELLTKNFIQKENFLIQA